MSEPESTVPPSHAELTGRFYEFALEELPSRPVQRARVLLALMTEGGNVAVVLDADHDEFVVVPAIPDGKRTRVLSLAPNGRHLLLLAQRGRWNYDSLCLHTLATGAQHWFDAQSQGQDWLAALSPDGRTIATLTSTLDDHAAIHLLDVPSGRRRRLWAAPGDNSAESTVNWSPDGQMVAATYLTDRDEIASVVIDMESELLGRYDDVQIPPSANGVWTSERELLCIDSEWQLVAVTPHDDARRLLGHRSSKTLAALGDRLVEQPALRGDDPLRLFTADMDGTNQQPFITVHPRRTIAVFDTAFARPSH